MASVLEFVIACRNMKLEAHTASCILGAFMLLLPPGALGFALGRAGGVHSVGVLAHCRRKILSTAEHAVRNLQRHMLCGICPGEARRAHARGAVPFGNVVMTSEPFSRDICLTCKLSM